MPTEGVKLTKAQRQLLEIAARDHGDEWAPRFDHAHPKHGSTLLELRAAGYVAFTVSSPRIRITDLGRAALTQPETPDHG